MSEQSYTVIFNKGKSQIYVGCFAPENGKTAHQQLKEAAPTKGNNTWTGASIQGNNLAGSSETFNKLAHGKCAVDGRTTGKIIPHLESGNFVFVNADKSTRKGFPIFVTGYKKY